MTPASQYDSTTFEEFFDRAGVIKSVICRITHSRRGYESQFAWIDDRRPVPQALEGRCRRRRKVVSQEIRVRERRARGLRRSFIKFFKMD